MLFLVTNKYMTTIYLFCMQHEISKVYSVLGRMFIELTQVVWNLCSIKQIKAKKLQQS